MRSLGNWGEDKAAEFLLNNSYSIIDRQYRTRFGEIDIIAQKDGFIVFVEVKLRKNDKFGRPMEMVTYTKQQKIMITAEQWMCENITKLQPRFDVIEVYAPNGVKTAPNQINHIKNAF